MRFRQLLAACAPKVPPRRRRRRRRSVNRSHETGNRGGPPSAAISLANLTFSPTKYEPIERIVRTLIPHKGEGTIQK